MIDCTLNSHTFSPSQQTVFIVAHLFSCQSIDSVSEFKSTCPTLYMLNIPNYSNLMFVQTQRYLLDVIVHIEKAKEMLTAYV